MYRKFFFFPLINRIPNRSLPRKSKQDEINKKKTNKTRQFEFKEQLYFIFGAKKLTFPFVRFRRCIYKRMQKKKKKILCTIRPPFEISYPYIFILLNNNNNNDNNYIVACTRENIGRYYYSIWPACAYNTSQTNRIKIKQRRKKKFFLIKKNRYPYKPGIIPYIKKKIYHLKQKLTLSCTYMQCVYAYHDALQSPSSHLTIYNFPLCYNARIVVYIYRSTPGLLHPLLSIRHRCTNLLMRNCPHLTKLPMHSGVCVYLHKVPRVALKYIFAYTRRVVWGLGLDLGVSNFPSICIVRAALYAFAV